VTTRLPGIVLAAGASIRMGRPKAFLPLMPGGTVLGRVLGVLADAGVSPLIVVAREPKPTQAVMALGRTALRFLDAAQRLLTAKQRVDRALDDTLSLLDKRPA
jgi:CTP:molybdopterin cytidylyltransferase MocA